MKNNFGFIAKQNGEIAGECYIIAIGDEMGEIAIFTSEKYRGQGVASLIASVVLEECLNRKLTPVLSCDASNIASFKTAVKLEFEIKRYFNCLRYVKNGVLF